MTARRFSAAEVGGVRSLVPVARTLEAYAAQTPVPAHGLVDRIMAALGEEPTPTPAAVFSRALQGRSFATVLENLAALTRMALGIGRWVPVAVRAQALAILLTVTLVVLGSGAALAAGAAGIVDAIRPPAAPAAAPPAAGPPANGSHASGAGREKRPHGKSQVGRGQNRGRGGRPDHATRPGEGSTPGHATPRPAKPGNDAGGRGGDSAQPDSGGSSGAPGGNTNGGSSKGGSSNGESTKGSNRSRP